MMVRYRKALLAVALCIGGVSNAVAQSRPEVNVSGLIFGSWSMDLGTNAASNNRFDLGRAYVNLRAQTSEQVSFRITTDAIRNAGQELQIRLKYGYVAYQLRNAPITFRFGQTHTPFVELEENLWEYRIQGNVPVDRLKYMTTSDLGFSADGSWGEGDQVHVTTGVYNGETWSKGEVDSGKDFMARATVRLASNSDKGALGGLRLTGYGQVGNPAGGGKRQRVLGMLSWRAPQFTLATEYMMATDRADTDDVQGTEIKGTLFNTFAVVKVPNTTAVFIGRLALYDPNRDLDGDRQTSFTGGVGVKLAPELRILGSMDYTTYQTEAPSAALDASRIRGIFTVALTF